MKIFNQFRRKLIGQKGGDAFKKYVLYAFGEIVLVVIGILIALYINNTNQQRQYIDEEKAIVERLKIQMQSDIEEVNQALKFLDQQEDLFDLFIYPQQYDFDKVLEITRNQPYGAMMGTQLLNLEAGALEMLTKRKPTETPYDSVLSVIENTYRYSLKSLETNEKVIVDELVNNLNDLKQEKDWYYKMISGQALNREELEYFDTPDYRNRIASLYLKLYDGYESEIYLVQEQLKKNLKLLESIE